jgi:hypothetical protein
MVAPVFCVLAVAAKVTCCPAARLLAPRTDKKAAGALPLTEPPPPVCVALGVGVTRWRHCGRQLLRMGVCVGVASVGEGEGIFRGMQPPIGSEKQGSAATDLVRGEITDPARTADAARRVATTQSAIVLAWRFNALRFRPFIGALL